jgi:hypothetical protein
MKTGSAVGSDGRRARPRLSKALATLTKPVSALAVVVVAGGVAGFISSSRPIETAPAHVAQAPPPVDSIPDVSIPDVGLPHTDAPGPDVLIVVRPDGARSPDPQPVRLEVP